MRRDSARAVPSVEDGARRLGLKDANEMRRDELFVASEVEAVASRNRGGDAAKRRGERGDNHRVGHFLVPGVLGGHLHECFRQASPSVRLLGGKRR